MWLFTIWNIARRTFAIPTPMSTTTSVPLNNSKRFAGCHSWYSVQNPTFTFEQKIQFERKKNQHSKKKNENLQIFWICCHNVYLLPYKKRFWQVLIINTLVVSPLLASGWSKIVKEMSLKFIRLMRKSGLLQKKLSKSLLSHSYASVAYVPDTISAAHGKLHFTF